MTASAHREPAPKETAPAPRPCPAFLAGLHPFDRIPVALAARRAENHIDAALRELISAARLRVPLHGREIVALGALAAELGRRLAVDNAAAGDLEADPGGHDR